MKCKRIIIPMLLIHSGFALVGCKSLLESSTGHSNTNHPWRYLSWN